MELREITSFVYVAREKSFSRASNILGYSQATITIQIKQLEKKLGVILFDRLGKNITLTPNGEIFFQHAVNILKNVEEAKNSVLENEELRGSLNIGTISSFARPILMPLIKEYRKLYPKVKLNIIMDTPSTLFDMLKNSRLDLVYLMDQRIYDSSLIQDLEVAESIIFVCSKKSKEIYEKCKSIDNILDKPLFLTEKNASYRFILENFLAARHIKISPIVETESTDFLIDLLENDNRAISFLPKFAVLEKLKEGKLFELDIKDFHLRIWRQLFHHKNKYETKEMKAFTNILKNDFKY